MDNFRINNLNAQYENLSKDNSEIIQEDYYILGQGDILKLNIFGAPELSGEVLILNDGTISIPILGAVSIFGIKNLIFSNNLSFTYLNLLSIILSFLFSLITIKYFLKYINKFNLNIFVYYRILLGLFLIFFAYL